MNRILIIDDEEKIRTLLSRIIALEGFEVSEAANLKAGLKKLETTETDIVICDVKLPDGNGVDFSKTIKDRFPHIEIILLTAFGTIADAVTAIKNGAFDYLTKGDDNMKILPLLYKAAEKVTLNRRVLQLEKQLNRKQSFDSIIGKSTALQMAISAAKKVAQTDATVLLTGETGTGKEVFAQAIHHSGARSKENFIAVNCSAFGKDLLENELFGHRAGAFTGAMKDSKGIFEEANRGTVFLDEIGEMPLDLQAKLLRVLESGEFIKVGDSRPTKTDVRIIAATNRDLKNEISLGNFREDLFYRINIFTIQLPSLRERREDVPLLAEFFLRKFSAKSDQHQLSFSPEYLKILSSHQWKGNIRELRNIVERSVILSENGEILPESLPSEILSEAFAESTSHGKILSAFSLASAEKMQIQKIMNHTKGNKAEAARLLEIGIATLYRKLEEYRIQ